MRRLVLALLIGCGSSANPTSPPPPPPAPQDAAPAPADAESIDAAVATPTAVSPPVDTTTGASPSWTAGPPVIVGDSVDGAALRAENRARLAADHSAVTILTGGTARELGQRLCEAVVPARPAEMPVLLKPNMSGIDWFRNPKTNHGDNGVVGRTTDPEFVRGVVRCLKARGHTAITIADGFTGKAADWDRLIKVSGYAAMAKDEGVRLVAMDDDGVWDVQGDQPGKPLGVRGMEKTGVPTLLMPKLLAEHLDHGLVIALPKIKTHRFAVFSIGIKLLQGTAMYSDAAPAFHQKWRTHKEIGAALALVKKGDPRARAAYVKSLERFAERMADILEIEAPDVVLAEGAPAMSGDGFAVMLPSKERVAIGGTNVILVDRVGAQFLGLWNHRGLARELGGHTTSPLLEVAAKRFGVDIAAPTVVGDGAPLLAKPRPAHLIGMANFEIDDAPPAHEPIHAAHVADGLAPTIDGAPDAIWDRAPARRFVTDYSGATTPTATTVRMLWGAHGLYLRWELESAGLFTDQTRPTDVERVDLYEEDCVELFLAPDPETPARYFEIEVGPFGHWFDIAVDRTGAPGAKKADNAWSGGLVIGTSRDPVTHRAVVEVAVTDPAVIAALVAGASLPIGLDRMEGQRPRQYLMAFPGRTARPSFHAPSGFGALVLDP
ncbi:MAG: DUF362 domain-containing protein [Deltaproteobacteria bacterium]|nr:DUF362 domain-containing protein [Deltaproteobacteria bacterium]